MIQCRKPPVISIIIPVYNSERYIHRCIDSVLRQTFPDYELILVDDGSSDLSGEICDSYANKDIRIKVIHQINSGVSSARNTGIAMAKGKYITFCDSDDELWPDYLAVMNNAPEDEEMVIAGWQYIDEKGKEIFASHGYERDDQIPVNRKSVEELIIDEKTDYAWAKRFLSNKIRENQIRFDETESFGEDTLFVFKYLCCCHSVSIKKNIIYSYRYHDGSRLTGFSKLQFAKLKSSNEKIIQVIEKRFPDFHNNYVWRKRIWSVGYYSILNILNAKNVSLAYKNKLIKEICEDKDFSSLLPETESFYAGNKKLFIKLFRMRSSELMIAYWELARGKRWIKKSLAGHRSIICTRKK